MEVIAKISKGTVMDQVYIPKNRAGLDIGTFVTIKPIKSSTATIKPFYYNIIGVEPIKTQIIIEIMQNVDKLIENYQNIIITGSFLDKGFHFNDIDIIIITEAKLDINHVKEKIEDGIMIKTHIIAITNKSFIKGLSTDPLYQMMISKCASKNRLIYKIKKRIDYKILDLHLLKSKILINNFDLLSGDEKYYLVRNMIAIALFLKHKTITKHMADLEIKKLFNLKDTKKIKQNMLNKKEFTVIYKKTYKKTFEEIMANIKNGTKQK